MYKYLYNIYISIYKHYLFGLHSFVDLHFSQCMYIYSEENIDSIYSMPCSISSIDNFNFRMLLKDKKILLFLIKTILRIFLLTHFIWLHVYILYIICYYLLYLFFSYKVFRDINRLRYR